MKIMFVGESPARELFVAGGWIVATKNEPVEVPDDVARSLLEQDVWQAVKASKKEQG